jgi:hypothetical protein
MFSVRAKKQKARLAEAIVKDVMAITNVGDDAVSVTTRKSNRMTGRQGIQAGHRERRRQL